MTPEEKQKKLFSYLGSLEGVAVAFSGGVDSTYLLWAAREALGDRVLALTVASDFVPRRELDRAETFCRERGIPLTVVPVDVLAVPGVADNPPDRCYLCKKALFTHLWEAARERGFSTLAEGSNADDDGDYRPGLRAVRELSAASPLREAELTKADIRLLSRAAGLPTWNKPSLACLASRVPYGDRITEAKLSMADRGELSLLERGFSQVRVRVHGNVARIEVPPEELKKLMELRTEIAAELRHIGFAYVTMDLEGYRTGSLNEVLHERG